MEDSGSSPSGVTGEPVDTTGLSFTATYDDGTTGSVVPSSYTPTSFGDTAGTQTVTFSFAGTDITVDVDYDVEQATLTVTSLSVVGTPETQYYGQELNLTATSHHDLAFTYGLSNGESGTITDIDTIAETGCISFTSTALDENYCWTAAGTQTITFTVNSESEYWADLGYVVADPEPSTDVQFNVVATLDSLSVSGSFTNTQYTGSAPDLTGLTFTATYDDQSTKTVSASDIVCTPSVWDASGNPNNLGTQNIVFTYTEDGNSVSTGINGTVIHRPTEQSIEFKSGTPSHVYFDYDPSWGSMSGPAQIFSEMGGSGTGVGDRLMLFFNDAAYQNDTTVDFTTFGGWVNAYGMVTQASGTINTAGYVPAVGTQGPQVDPSESYVAVSVNGSTEATGTADTLHIVVGTAVNALSGSYKLSDLDSTGRTHYICHMIAD